MSAKPVTVPSGLPHASTGVIGTPVRAVVFGRPTRTFAILVQGPIPIKAWSVMRSAVADRPGGSGTGLGPGPSSNAKSPRCTGLASLSPRGVSSWIIGNPRKLQVRVLMLVNRRYLMSCCVVPLLPEGLIRI